MLAVFTVDSHSDDTNAADDRLTLREAILASNDPSDPGPHTIKFAENVFSATIVLNMGELLVENSHVWIQGPSSTLLTIDAGDNSRILRAVNAEVKLSGLTLTGGRAQVGDVSNGRGGALFNGGGVMILDDVVVKESTATLHGGGIYNSSSGDNIATLIVTNSVISDNQAAGGGAGVYSQRGDVQIFDSAITGNEASSPSSDGGGLINVDGLTVIRSSRIAGNLVGRHGGGVQIRGGTAEIINSTIGGEELQGNAATSGEGGGVSASGADLFVYGSTFSNNESRVGGGIYAESNGTAVTATIANSTISGNRASETGGGMHLDLEFAEVVSSTIAFNEAGDGGGMSIVNQNNLEVEMHNTVVAHNERNGSQNDILGQLCTNPPSDASPGSCRFASSYNLVSDESSAGGMTNDGVDVQQERFNLVGIDPDLPPLNANGGPTMTHAVQEESPLLDAGFRTFMLLADRTRVQTTKEFQRAADQRGVSRFSGTDSLTIDIGAYELDRTISTTSGVRSFSVVEHSQFGSGAASIGDDIFLGPDPIDLEPWSFGGFDRSRNNGFQITIDPEAIEVGLLAGYSLDQGSIDAQYDADLNISFEDPSSLSEVRITETVDYPLAEFTTSPNLSLGAYLDFVAKFGATIEAEACLFGSCFGPEIVRLSADLGQEIIAVNRDQDGELRVFDQTTIPNARELIESETQIHFPDIPVKQGTLLDGAKLKIDYEVAFEDCTAGPEGVGCRSEFDLIVKKKKDKKDKSGDAKDTTRKFQFGAATLKFPEMESLQANTPDLFGALAAASNRTRVGRDDDPTTIKIPALPDSLLAAARLEVGALLGGVLTTQKFDLGSIASIEFTPLSLGLVPAMYVEQSVEVRPINQVTYRFDSPVKVVVNNTPRLDPVDEITLSANDVFYIVFDGTVVEVTPEWHFGLDLHNTIELVTELKGLLTILDVGIDMNGALEAVLKSIGINTDELDPDPLFQENLFNLNLPPIHVFDREIPLLRQTMAMESFLVGENFEPSLVVTRRDDDKLAGTLRSAIDNANLLAARGGSQAEENS